MAKFDFDETETEEGNESVNTESSEQRDTSDSESKSTSLSRDEIVSGAFAEGTEDAVIESLASKETVTVDDLRQLPGTEGLTDEQLLAEWNKAQKAAGKEENGVEGDAKVELPFPVYDKDGNKLTGDKVSLQDLLSGKVTIGYNALGKEQRKALNDVIRNASQGHWNEHRYNTVNEQYRAANDKAIKLEKQIAEYTARETQWNAALTAAAMGDITPMKAILEAYKQGLTKTGVTPEGFVPQDQVAAEREATERGMQWYQEVGMPAAIDIASRYEAKPQEVIGAIKWYIENEPVLTPQRIDEIIKYDVPMLLEQNGYTAKNGSVNTQVDNTQQSNNEVAQLKKQIEELTARVASSANSRVETIREKNRKAPAAGSGSTPNAGDSMPNFKDRNSMKDWLRS